jgi:rSAM/selenodomain-associated transferase 2
VVVPTLDEERALPRLLERLLRADAPDRADRVVVADGGSADRTAALAREGGALLVLAPRGRGTQMRAGAEALGTDLLLFLHADCVPDPGALAALRDAFGSPGLEAAGMSQRIEAPGLFYRLVERAADLRVRRGMVYGDSGLCLRRAAYEAVGGFRELPLFEDVDLSRRLRAGARPRLVGSARIAVSARRWQREGPLRATARNWILRAAYAWGADPARLARRYAPHSPGALDGGERGPRA